MSEQSRFDSSFDHPPLPDQGASLAERFYRDLSSHRRGLAAELATTTDDELTQRARSQAAQRMFDRLLCLYFLLEADAVEVHGANSPDIGEPGVVMARLVSETDDPWQHLSTVFFDRLDATGERMVPLDGGASLHLPYQGGLFAPLSLPTVDGEPVREDRSLTATSADWTGVIETLNGYSWSLDGHSPERGSPGDETITPAVIGAVSERFVTGAGQQPDGAPTTEVREDCVDEIAAEGTAGAYYTDRGIAGFVARRALWQALRQTIEDDMAAGRAPPQLSASDLYRPARDLRADIEGNLETGFDLLTESLPDDPAIRAYLDDKLAGLTVCDPAAGSGEFLMAIAEALYEWRLRCVPTADPTALRREIVTESIHGVDLLGTAAEICTLRLSLWVMQADSSTDTGPPPLPDLDEAIRTGNSLIGVARPQRVNGAVNATADESPEARSSVRATVDQAYLNFLRDGEGDHLQVTDPVASPAAVTESLQACPDAATLCVTVDDGIPDPLASELSDIGFQPYTYKARHESPPASERGLAPIFDALDRHQPMSTDWSVSVERPLAPLDCAPDRLDALHWPLAFPDVFDDGGFDLVISNPPYGAEVPTAAGPILTNEAAYECQGARDTCEWFYERALELAHDDGVVAYLVTKSLAFYASWADIREKLLTETSLERVYDVGLGFDDVNLETIALVHTLGKSPEGSPPVHRSADPRSRTDNRPVHLGYADESYMRDAGTILFRPISRTEGDILDRLLAHDRRLGDVMSTDATTRQLYIPDSEKADLPAGEDAYINKNPWVDEFTLEDVWFCDLGAYREEAAAYAVPRVMLKVLRGSRLRAWLDPYGELVGTEKLVNIPLEDHSPAEIAFVYAALNHPCASFYLQKAVFSETTETARVMDGQYSGSIPLPEVGDDAREAVATLAWTLTMAKAAQPTGDRNVQAAVTAIQEGLEALVGAMYLDLEAALVEEWLEDCHGLPRETGEVEALFSTVYTDRWATPEGDPSGYRSEVAGLTDEVTAMVTDWGTARILDTEQMDAVRDVL